jgi:hypothetical protein
VRQLPYLQVCFIGGNVFDCNPMMCETPRDKVFNRNRG